MDLSYSMRNADTGSYTIEKPKSVMHTKLKS